MNISIVRQTHSVTHEGTFELDVVQQDKEERIYSGVEASPVVLTVRLTSPPSNSEVEVIVNGSTIADGVITQVGLESRTFRIRSARTMTWY